MSCIEKSLNIFHVVSINSFYPFTWKSHCNNVCRDVWKVKIKTILNKSSFLSWNKFSYRTYTFLIILNFHLFPHFFYLILKSFDYFLLLIIFIFFILIIFFHLVIKYYCASFLFINRVTILHFKFFFFFWSIIYSL